MNPIKQGATWVVVYIYMPIWSFIINCGYWLKRMGDWSTASDKKKELAKKTKTLANVRSTMKKFKWKKDSFKDWKPWVITIINNELTDDCDGAAVLGKWLLKQIGTSSRIIHLRGPNAGHAVTITKDNALMISNHQVIDIKPTSWEADVYTYFKDRYTAYV